MTAPFSVDPLSLPPADGASLSALARLRRQNSPRADDLERLIKRSSHAVLVGENEERWPQEAREALLAAHPWLAGYTITEHITASSPEGYATGFFRVTPRHVPVAVAGAETVAVVTVPVVIKDFRLYPLDLFSIEGKSYPLTEDRVAPLLRLRDAFGEVEREYPVPVSTGVGSLIIGPSAGGRGGSKYSSASLVAEAKHLLAEAHGSLPRPLSSEDVNGFDGVLRSRVKQAASVCAVDLQMGEHAVHCSTTWASDPERGEARSFPPEKMSLSKVSEMFGGDVRRALEADGRVVLNLNPEDVAATVAALDARAPEALSPLLVDNDFAKISNASAPPATAEIYRLVYPDGGEEIEGALVNSYRARMFSDDGDWSLTNGALASVSAQGMVTDLSAPSPAADRSAILVGPTVAPTGGTIQVSPFGYSGDTGTGLALWQEDECLWGLPVTASTLMLDGVTHYVAPAGGQEPLLVSVGAGFAKAVAELSGEARIVHLPAGAWVLVDGQVVQEGAPLSLRVIGGPGPAEHASAPEDPDLPYRVTVSCAQGDFYVKTSLAAGGAPVGTLRTEHDAKYVLAAGGVPGALADALVAAARESRDKVSAAYRAPHFARGRQVLEVAAQLQEKLSSKVDVGATVAAIKRALPSVAALRDKTSSFDNSVAVDTVLSLGFLTRENLLRFVGMSPDLNQVLNYLCSLLLASRLGLDEVEEEAVMSAIRGVDSVLSSLRAVEYALTQR